MVSELGSLTLCIYMWSIPHSPLPRHCSSFWLIWQHNPLKLHIVYHPPWNATTKSTGFYFPQCLLLSGCLSYMRTMKWLANIQLLFALVGLFSFSVCPNAPHNCCRCFVHQTMGKHRATRATIATFVVSYLFGCMAKLPKHCC